MTSPGLADSFAVDASGRKLAVSCWGSGSPTVFFESGGGALDEWRYSPVVRRVAMETRVCLANRAGHPPSDPAPNQPREAEDVAADFHALTDAAGIEGPFVLFGRSVGGMIVTFHASEYPQDVAGVIVFDSPAPSADMTLEEFPEGAWDHPDNVEHVNGLTGYENRFGKTPVHFDAPLILISTTAGESRPDDLYWLQTSPESRQVVLGGGMEVIDTEAERISLEILSLVHGNAGASPSP
jgi:pimeloyl-ACP methyl ester carboxylesterase